MSHNDLEITLNRTTLGWTAAVKGGSDLATGSTPEQAVQSLLDDLRENETSLIEAAPGMVGDAV